MFFETRKGGKNSEKREPFFELGFLTYCQRGRAKGPELAGHPVCLIVLQSSSCVNCVISQLSTNVGESLGQFVGNLQI